MTTIQTFKVDPNTPEVLTYLNEHAEEIETYFPHFEIEDIFYSSCYLLKDSEKVAGIFIYQAKGEELHVDLDYLTKDYRNKGIGADFFRNKIQDFKKTGFTTVISLTSNNEHINYLIQCGFKASSMHPDRYELSLT